MESAVLSVQTVRDLKEWRRSYKEYHYVVPTEPPSPPEPPVFKLHRRESDSPSERIVRAVLASYPNAYSHRTAIDRGFDISEDVRNYFYDANKFSIKSRGARDHKDGPLAHISATLFGKRSYLRQSKEFRVLAKEPKITLGNLLDFLVSMESGLY